MELLLNLVWLALALLSFDLFVTRRKATVRHRRAPFGMASLALACALVLLFPVVSASDDLHPTQAVLEDATKRVQQLSAAHHGNFSFSSAMVPALLALYLLPTVILLSQWLPAESEARVISLSRKPIPGRSPPPL